MHQVKNGDEVCPGLGMNAPTPSPSTFVQKNLQLADGNLFSVLTPPSSQDKRTRQPAPAKTQKGRRKCRWKLKFHHQALPPEYREHYEASEGVPTASAAEAVARLKKEEQKVARQSKASKAPSRSSVIMPSAEVTERPVQDLPYMGEITLDSKPRRGRKPKKADICHLIYKNYGTVFPPNKVVEEDSTVHTAVPPVPKPNKLIWAKDPQQLMAPKSAVGQCWTPSSLLERRLTVPGQDKGHQFLVPHPSEFPPSKQICDFSMLERKKSSSSSSVRSSDVDDAAMDVVRSPQLAQACVQRLLSLAAASQKDPSCVQAEPLNLCTRDRTPSEAGLLLMSSSSDESDDLDEGKRPNPDDFVFWPNSFVHPLFKPTPPPPPPPPPKLKPPPSSPTTSTAAAAGKKKRKRSAIFIPPAESPTEVSICKFKFTGGAKPSLEEKKMLSVDAGGNFRFYSGTDKGMRSFLPHLQQQQQLHAAAPPSTSSSPTQGVKNLHLSDRLPPPHPPHHHQNYRLHPSPPAPLPPHHHPLNFLPGSAQHDELMTNKRKRRSRKSEVREKLEKTFKEKGFLIQTQQLESAEGATYCKFRQLRKFTRYLFRSWRDYLPENVQQLPTNPAAMTAAAAAAAAAAHQMRMHEFEQSNSPETVIAPAHSP